VDRLARDKKIGPAAIEVWFADEARVGLKNKITRRWARRGTRISAPHDQRTASTYIFGAICPKDGKGAALVLPRCNIAAMNLHLAEIATAVAPGAHAVLVLDQAGWHLSDKLIVPPNITLVPLLPKCPELNPVENVWQFIRDTGSQIACSAPTATSSNTVALPGTSSSTSRGPLCRSDCAIGHTGSDQRDLVLVLSQLGLMAAERN
jgi:hypothetical protein